MANGGESKDLYEVLGLNKECTATELRNAYKKLALTWHPDRCSAPGNSKFAEEAKNKFQSIQQAYSVLSDTNKRFLYDVGVYDSDDDENNGMGDFLNEMAVMMSQTKPNPLVSYPMKYVIGPINDCSVRWAELKVLANEPDVIWWPPSKLGLYLFCNCRVVLPSVGHINVKENVEESFEELQALFDEMFQGDLESFGMACQSTSSFSTSSYSESSNSNNKRVSVEMNLGKNKLGDSSGFDSCFEKFCLGTGGTPARFQEGMGGKRRNSRRNRRYEARPETKDFAWP